MVGHEIVQVRDLRGLIQQISLELAAQLFGGFGVQDPLSRVEVHPSAC